MKSHLTGYSTPDIYRIHHKHCVHQSHVSDGHSGALTYCGALRTSLHVEMLVFRSGDVLHLAETGLNVILTRAG